LSEANTLAFLNSVNEKKRKRFSTLPPSIYCPDHHFDVAGTRKKGKNITIAFCYEA
jgi:hypothetical protein